MAEISGAAKVEFSGAAVRIKGLAPYRKAAATLNCELAAILAVAEVESRGEPFDELGRPVILFERHIFHKRTNGVHSKDNPDISSATPGAYGASRAQHDRLARAIALDRKAALESASWGVFQIMGFNHAAAGHLDVEAFVSAMVESEVGHLNAFVAFIKADKRLIAALRAKNWAAFASAYNGPQYAKNKYDQKLPTAFAKHEAQLIKVGECTAKMQRVQSALYKLGLFRGPQCGVLTWETSAAIRDFDRRSPGHNAATFDDQCYEAILRADR